MSIAVSAVVHPSRVLSALIGAMVLVAVSVAAAIGLGLVGDLSAPVRGLLSSSVFFLASFGFYHGIRCRKTIQLDISGTGQIRLLRDRDNPSCASVDRPHVMAIGELVRLTDNSTIWSSLILLRLQALGGKVVTVPVLFDSVDRESFRALLVACRWISERNKTLDIEIF